MYTQECRPHTVNVHMKPCTCFTFSCFPLLIVVITHSGKSHFHKVTFSTQCHSFFRLGPPPFLLPLFLLSPSAPLLYSSSSHLHVSISLHSPTLPLALTFHLSPVICSSLSPTPSFAPSIFSLLHGLASSLYLSPFIYINEQKSPFHLPPDEQTLHVEEDRRKEEQRNTASLTLSFQLYLAVGIPYYINSPL